MEFDNLISELVFKAIRSSGAGGQHVNKVSSKIELTFDLKNSLILNQKQKDLLVKNLATKLTKEQVLKISCDESRSQHRNKEIAIKRFLTLIQKGLIVPKKRKATKPTKAAIKRRLTNKKRKSEKKTNRKNPDLD